MCKLFDRILQNMLRRKVSCVAYPFTLYFALPRHVKTKHIRVSPIRFSTNANTDTHERNTNTSSKTRSNDSVHILPHAEDNELVRRLFDAENKYHQTTNPDVFTAYKIIQSYCEVLKLEHAMHKQGTAVSPLPYNFTQRLIYHWEYLRHVCSLEFGGHAPRVHQVPSDEELNILNWSLVHFVQTGHMNEIELLIQFAEQYNKYNKDDPSLKLDEDTLVLVIHVLQASTRGHEIIQWFRLFTCTDETLLHKNTKPTKKFAALIQPTTKSYMALIESVNDQTIDILWQLCQNLFKDTENRIFDLASMSVDEKQIVFFRMLSVFVSYFAHKGDIPKAMEVIQVIQKQFANSEAYIQNAISQAVNNAHTTLIHYICQQQTAEYLPKVLDMLEFLQKYEMKPTPQTITMIISAHKVADRDSKAILPILVDRLCEEAFESNDPFKVLFDSALSLFQNMLEAGQLQGCFDLILRLHMTLVTHPLGQTGQIARLTDPKGDAIRKTMSTMIHKYLDSMLLRGKIFEAAQMLSSHNTELLRYDKQGILNRLYMCLVSNYALYHHRSGRMANRVIQYFALFGYTGFWPEDESVYNTILEICTIRPTHDGLKLGHNVVQKMMQKMPEKISVITFLRVLDLYALAFKRKGPYGKVVKIYRDRALSMYEILKQRTQIPLTTEAYVKLLDLCTSQCLYDTGLDVYNTIKKQETEENHARCNRNFAVYNAMLTILEQQEKQTGQTSPLKEEVERGIRSSLHASKPAIPIIIPGSVKQKQEQILI